ncbi:hypothetical protein Dtox_4237 [Desulfofarcimen acetoxidans DSM 771]|uniref:Uncharacterized protein n=1 Tax=Desulfofarcimen acetoxidans (strain ATCC 49208 / DSM 771 / KCTC 5769 / VKM B-1644 / 5575) TaxID=485916 RepID=C8VZF9_DESAS|nr:hypothetical protein [Desulfofarcimen acetoxidans]ACV64904.1 hypothetical protein Dtox_4237 [Desulfofarcimen acetoxidans DSM 771]
MDLVTVRRKNTIWSINQNPVTIIINRTEKVEANGYFNDIPSQVGSLVVRIFQVNGNGNRIESHLVGTKELVHDWALLADWQADLRAGSHVRDEFEVPDMGFFVIKSVYPQRVQGQVVGYQAELEMVI